MSKKISLQCTNCYARLAANPSHIGRQLPCPKCGATVDVTSTVPRYNSTPSSDVATPFNGTLTPTQIPDIRDFQFETTPELGAKSHARWQTGRWIPTLLASIAIVLCGIQFFASRQSTDSLSEEFKILVTRLDTAEKDVIALQSAMDQLKADAGMDDNGESDAILTARLWRTQKAIDDAMEEIGEFAEKADSAYRANQNTRTPRRMTWPDQSETRVFESEEAEKEAKQIALAFKKIADAERERKRAEARKNAVKK